MKRPTNSYTSFTRALKRCGKIVWRLPDNDILTDAHELKMRSYILLIHSTLEEYLESLSREIAEASIWELRNKRRINTSLISLIAAYRSDIADGFESFNKHALAREILEYTATEALEKHKGKINQNHGIKKNHQRTMFAPIGVSVGRANSTLPDLLESFGEKRGGVAHRIGIRTVHTRSDIRMDASRIKKALLDLDRECCNKFNELVVADVDCM